MVSRVGSSNDGEAVVSRGDWSHGVGSGCNWNRIAVPSKERGTRTRVVGLYRGGGQW